MQPACRIYSTPGYLQIMPLVLTVSLSRFPRKAAGETRDGSQPHRLRTVSGATRCLRSQCHSFSAGAAHHLPAQPPLTHSRTRFSQAWTLTCLRAMLWSHRIPARDPCEATGRARYRDTDAPPQQHTLSARVVRMCSTVVM